MQPKIAGFLLVGLFALTTVPVRGEPSSSEFAAAIGRQGFGRCHMDQCGFFIIDAATPIGANQKGTLFAISFRIWEASYRPTSDDKEYDRKPIHTGPQTHAISLMFCSKTDPVEFDYFDGSWHEARLRPGDNDAVFGYNESGYTFYYAACHNYITKDAELPAELAKKLGYNFRGGFPDVAKSAADRQPFDMLK